MIYSIFTNSGYLYFLPCLNYIFHNIIYQTDYFRTIIISLNQCKWSTTSTISALLRKAHNLISQLAGSALYWANQKWGCGDWAVWGLQGWSYCSRWFRNSYFCYCCFAYQQRTLGWYALILSTSRCQIALTFVMNISYFLRKRNELSLTIFWCILCACYRRTLHHEGWQGFGFSKSWSSCAV